MDKKLIEWADAGDADAMFKVGTIYLNGDGTEQDYSKAIEYFTKAAKMDYKDADYQLGKIYRDGIGVEQDYSKAIDYFKKAANLKHRKAIENIVDMCVKKEIPSVKENLDFVIKTIEAKFFIDIYSKNPIKRMMNFRTQEGSWLFDFTPKYKDSLEMRRLLNIVKKYKAECE